MSRHIHAAMHAPKQSLRLRWRSGMTPDFELQEGSPPIRGWVGVRRNHDHDNGRDHKGRELPKGRIESHDDEVVKPWRPEYLKAIVEEHLWACDEYTAREATKLYGAKGADWKQYLAPPLDPATPANAEGDAQ